MKCVHVITVKASNSPLWCPLTPKCAQSGTSLDATVNGKDTSDRSVA